MTEQEFDKLRFTMVSHLNMEKEHAATYESVDFRPTIGCCIHTKVKKDGTFGKSYRHYRFKGKVYESKQEVIDAINAHLAQFENKLKTE